MTVDAPHHMTPNLANMNDTSVSSNEGGDIKSSPSGGGAVVADSSSEDLNQQQGSSSKGSSPEKRSTGSNHGGGDVPLSPTPQMASATNYSSSQGTPQPNRATGAYMVSSGYHHHHHQQMTPEPPSPGGPVVLHTSNDAYTVGSFFQQQAGAFVPSHTSPFGVSQPSPLSPPRPTAVVAMGAMGVIPPASPLFPRLSSGGGGSNVGTASLHPSDSGLSGVSSRGGAPPSPSLPYSTMYQTYGSNQVVSSHSIISPDDGSGGVSGSWNDR